MHNENPAAKHSQQGSSALSLEQSARKLSSDKQQSTYSQVWISLGDSIPGLYCEAWLGLSHVRKCQFEYLCEKERNESCSVQRMFTAETFGKRRKRENSPVVRLPYQVPTSVLLQETHAFCARNMGVHVQCTSLECQGYKKRDEKLDSCAAEKGAKKFVSSDLAKIIEYESSNS